MARQLESFFKDFLLMDEEEQLEVIRRVRDNKYRVRPAATQKRTAAKKKSARKTSKKVESLLGKLTPEQIAKLKEQHGVK